MTFFQKPDIEEVTPNQEGMRDYDDWMASQQGSTPRPALKRLTRLNEAEEVHCLLCTVFAKMYLISILKDVKQAVGTPATSQKKNVVSKPPAEKKPVSCYDYIS